MNTKVEMDLGKYLKGKKVIDSNKPYNFTTSFSTDGIPRGKFKIEKEDIDTFLDKYYKHTFIDNKKSTLLERPFSSKNKPYFVNNINNSNVIKIDLDFRHNLSEDEIEKKVELERKYDLEQIELFIETYIEKLAKYVNIPNDIKVYLMEKDKPTIKNMNSGKVKKDGIHILMPGYLTPNKILHQVRTEIIDDTDIKELFNSMDTTNTINDIVDECVIDRNSWFLYGGGKASDLNYKVSKVYNIKIGSNDCISIEETDIPSNKELVKLLSNLCVSKKISTKSNTLEEPINPNVGNEDLSEIFSETERRIPHSHISGEYTAYIIDLISSDRADNYLEWLKVGCALFNSDARNYTVWIKFSKKCQSKFSESVCRDYWDKFQYMSPKFRGLNIGYLKKLAKKDNPEKYEKTEKKWHTESLKDIIKKMKTHKKCPAATFAEYTKDYINSHSEKNMFCVHDASNHITWYFYDGCRWVEDKGAINLRKFLVSDYIKAFTNATTLFLRERQFLSQNHSSLERDNNIGNIYEDNRAQISNNMDEIANNLDEFESLAVSSSNITNWLESKSTRDNIITDMATWYTNESLYQELDCNNGVFICKNGVLDLESCEFRPGNPNDMMTRYSNIAYISVEDIAEDRILSAKFDELQEFLDKIFPDYDLQTYFINQLAECLDGHQHRQELLICTGSGSNGKSKIFELLEYVFGDYSIKTSPSLLTKMRGDANTATPALADLRGKRLAFCEEPNENESIKTGIMKGLTGGDSITARQLHKPNITFKPQHKLFISCNDKPDIESTDDGTRRRLKIVPFVSKFCDPNDPRLEDPDKFPNHYMKENVDTKFEGWAPLFLALLFNKYKSLKQDKFVFPETECMKQASMEYMNQQNVFFAYANENMVEKAGEKCAINDVWNSFREWAKTSNNNNKSYKKHNFIMNMDRILGKSVNRKWKGWILADYIDDESDNNNLDSEDDSDNS